MAYTRTLLVSTETYQSLHPFVEIGFGDLQSDLERAVSGVSLRVDPDGFQNDMTTIDDKDDILALLIHLGHLAHDEVSR